MNLTNRSNLPEALVRAIRNDGYSKGNSDFSVTELLKPARQRELQVRHRHLIEEDVEDRLFSLYGQIAHLIIERANEGTDIAETRYFSEFAGKIVSAQIDTLSVKDGVLSDFKFTTAWKFKGGKAADDSWTAQLNMQLEILRRNGLDAKELRIIGLLRDFSKAEARKSETYPQAPVVTVPIEMWSREKTTAFIEARVKEHLNAQKELPLCSKDERWATDDMWAVMKRGQKRAVKLFADFNDAKAFAEAMGAGHGVEARPGEAKRCALYCNVSAWCSQFNDENKNT